MGYSLKFRKEVIKFREDRGLTVIIIYSGYEMVYCESLENIKK
jgi:hypothetical protein